MYCVCEEDCQLHVGGGIKFYSEGQVDDFDECPDHFTSVLDPDFKLDFTTASEAELFAADWDKRAAVRALKKAYKTTLNINPGETKKDIIRSILDIRYRNVD